jgi:hypothetical protein
MDPVTICAVAFDGVYTRWVPLYGAFLAAVAMGAVGGAIGYTVTWLRYRWILNENKKNVLEYADRYDRLRESLSRAEITSALTAAESSHLPSREDAERACGSPGP